MKKIKELSKKEVELIRCSDVSTVKQMLGITGDYGLGDSLVSIGSVSHLGDVYKNEHNGKESYYVVAHPVGESMAFCYILYPVA